jgi:hypothetical protein
MLKFDIKTEGFEKAAKTLEGMGQAFPRAASEAINKGLIAGRALAVRLIRTRYDIQSGELKGKGMELQRSTNRSMGGVLRAAGPMLPVSAFPYSAKRMPLKGKGSRRNPIKAQFIKVKILNKGGKKLVKGAFLAKGRIWERRGPGRDAPLGIVSTIGVPQMVAYLGISKQVEKRIAETTQKRLEHNVAFELEKAKR